LASRQKANPRAQPGNDDQSGGKTQEFCTTPKPIDRKQLFSFKILDAGMSLENPSAPPGKAYLSIMTKLLEHAVDSVRALPPEVQDELALQAAGDEQPVIQLTAEECADLTDADAEIARGEFATDEQIRSMLAKRTV
jgi:hypothetical protein